MVVANPNPDLSGQFERDWNQAQERYRVGVRSGYSAEDADKLYLDPIRAKWKIIGSSPLISSSPQKLKQFSSEFETANENFLKNNNTYGRDGGDWAAQESNSILPALSKWSILGSLPMTKGSTIPQSETEIRKWYKNSPVMQDEASAAQLERAQGIPTDQIQHDHPTVFKYEPYKSRFEIQGAKDATALAKKPTAAELNMRQRIALQPKLDNVNLPPDIQKTLGDEAAALDAQRTNAVPTIGSQPWQIQPTASDEEITAAQDALPDFGATPVTAPKYATKFRTADEVKAAFKSKELSKDEAVKLLQEQFGLQ